LEFKTINLNVLKQEIYRIRNLKNGKLETMIDLYVLVLLGSFLKGYSLRTYFIRLIILIQ
jgi:hypothetical protein